MCWFEGGVSTSGGAPETVRGLGLLEGSLSVHLEQEAERLHVYRDAVANGELPNGYAADDGAALVFEGRRMSECVASRAGARVLRVSADGLGGVREEALPSRLLPGALEPAADSEEISELRELRAGRHRWE
jgi:hypothetical protein